MKKILTTASLTLLLASCATLISGSRQDISFDSNEKHTRIFIDGKEVCQTPCIVKIDRENSQVMVQARKDGFEDKTIFINKGPNPMSALNVVSTVFSTFGLMTDLSSGGFWEYSPNSFYVTMQKEPKTAAEKKQRAYENKIRHFVLQNYGQLKTEVFSSDGNREYIKTVAEMTGLPKSDVIFIVQDTDSEGECAEKIINAYISK